MLTPARIATLLSKPENPLLFLFQGNGSLAFQERQNPARGDGRTKTGTATGSGAVRYQAAPGAYWNYCPNPSAEANATGYAATASGNTVNRITTDAAVGSACIESVGNGAFATQGVTCPSGELMRNVVGQQVTISVRLKGISGATSIRLQMSAVSAAGAYIGAPGLKDVTVTAGWVEYFITATVNSAGAHGVQLAAYVVGASAATFRVDGVQYQFGGSVLPYMDGSSGTWLNPITGMLGTAHASPSVSQAVAWEEEATTNLAINPSGEADLAFWNVGGGGAHGSKIQDATRALFGSKSIKFTPANGVPMESINCQAGNGLALTGTSNPYTMSIYANGVQAGQWQVTTSVTYTDASGASSSPVDVPALDGWQRIVGPVVTLNPAKTVATMYITLFTKVQHGNPIWLDGCQIEQKVYATSYCDGSIGSGYAWLGTAHASASTRAETTISVTVGARVNASRGAIVERVSPQFARAVMITVGDQHIHTTQVGAPGVNGFLLRWDASSFKIDGFAPGLVTAAFPHTYTAGNWYTTYADWDGSTMRATVNNGDLARGSGVFATPTINIYVGRRAGSSPGGSNLVGPVSIFARPLTTRERSKLASKSQWTWRDLDAA